MKIKLCGVRTVADALLCAEEGADEIGVIFAASSRRRVTVQEAKAIRDALPARVPLVGVFLDAELSEVVRVVAHRPGRNRRADQCHRLISNIMV